MQKQYVTKQKYGIIAVDKTISKEYPRKSIWLFDDEKERDRWLKLISEKEDYKYVEKYEFDRVVVIGEVVETENES